MWKVNKTHQRKSLITSQLGKTDIKRRRIAFSFARKLCVYLLRRGFVYSCWGYRCANNESDMQRRIVASKHSVECYTDRWLVKNVLARVLVKVQSNFRFRDCTDCMRRRSSSVSEFVWWTHVDSLFSPIACTPWTIKRWQYICNDNSGKSWWILITFKYLETGINTLRK